MNRRAEIENQAAFHRQLFAALYGWDVVWQVALDLAGERSAAVQLGLDQLGHFGPPGVELIADQLIATAHGPLTCVVEIGSGFAGALRHLGRILSLAGMHPRLIGVELVYEHCKLANTIGWTIGDANALTLNADARRLPFPPASIDAIFAVGSASHFTSAGQIMGECRRVLRPDGVLVMTEEVSLRPRGAREPGDAFIRHHPPTVFCAVSPEQRRVDLETAGLTIEAFNPLLPWALPLLRQRVHALRLLGNCATRIFGDDAFERLVGTLTSAADEYELGSIQPMLIVARHPRP